MSRRRWTALLAGAALPATLLLTGTSTAATYGAATSAGATEPQRRPGATAVLTSGPDRPHTLVRRPMSLHAGTSPTSIVVRYSGFTPEAQAAFEYAAGIWEQLLHSTVPIEVDASFATLPPGVLGGARADNYLMNFPGAPRADTWYADALANALAGKDLDTDPTSDAEILARFSSANPDWYFGTDGNTPFGKDDFVTAVLHELGHGLGFSGSMLVSAGLGYVSEGDPREQPFPYDTFVRTGAGRSVLAIASPSLELAAALQGGDLWFDGPKTLAAATANGLGRPRLYAPPVFQQGSSYSHLDEATYAGVNANALMTPMLNGGEAVHNPGPLALAMLADTGWPLAGSTPTASPSPSTSSSPSPTSSPSPGAQPAGISLGVDVPTITAGNAPLVGGFVTGADSRPVAGAPVTLYAKPYGTTAYTAVTTMTSGSDGFYSTPVRPNVQTAYLARTGSVQSSGVVVYVHNRVNVSSPRPGTVPSRTTIRGDLDPDFASVRVGVGTLRNGRFTYLTQGVGDATGNFAIPVSLPRGTYTLVVYTSARQGTLKGAKGLGVTVP